MRKPDALPTALLARARLERAALGYLGSGGFRAADGARLLGEAAAVAKMIARHIDENPLQNDEGGTPETHVKRRREEPVVVLLKKGHVDGRHVRAARSIATIHEHIVRVQSAKIVRMDTAGRRPEGSGWTEPETNGEIAERHAMIYIPWTKDVRRAYGLSLALVLDVSVYQIALGTVARAYGMAYNVAVRRLADALLMYWKRLEDYEPAAPG